MLRFILCAAFLAGGLAFTQTAALGQQRGGDVESLKREIELLKRELELLKRENEVLKRENELLKKGGGSAKTGDGKSADADDAPKTITVDDVDYTYLGTSRSGNVLSVTILANSQDGAKQGPNGSMVLIDDKGTKYTGRPSGGFGLQPVLREGVPVKLTWVFGAGSPLGGPNLAGVPSAKITRFAAVIIHKTVANVDTDTIDFRNVPAVVKKAKTSGTK